MNFLSTSATSFADGSPGYYRERAPGDIRPVDRPDIAESGNDWIYAVHYEFAVEVANGIDSDFTAIEGTGRQSDALEVIQYRSGRYFRFHTLFELEREAEDEGQLVLRTLAEFPVYYIIEKKRGTIWKVMRGHALRGRFVVEHLLEFPIN